MAGAKHQSQPRDVRFQPEADLYMAVASALLGCSRTLPSQIVTAMTQLKNSALLTQKLAIVQRSLDYSN
jgi:hypothetical protein